jgi:hypothetical protein
MTPTTFRFRLEALDVSVRQFAKLTGTEYGTVVGWGFASSDGIVPAFPSWVETVMKDWERDGVPKGVQIGFPWDAPG